MGIYKRPGRKFWLIRITSPSGRRIQISARTESKQEAQRLHDQIKADLWKQEKLGEKPRRTWKEAVVRWIKEQQGKSSLHNNILIITWLDKFFADKYLDEITKNIIENIAFEKEKQGVKNATINKTLALIRNILRKTEKEWEWIDKMPHIKMRSEPPGRVRFITQEEAAKLIENLPEHLKDLTIFALATGLRKSNVLNLKWNVIDMKKKHAYIEAINSKSRKPIPVPLNKIAMEILEKKLKSENKHAEYVFTYKSKPIQNTGKKSWKKAAKKAGIIDFKFHDLRHTWASWHVQNGTSLYELQQMGGWSKSDMVQRYAHLTSDHLKEAAERIVGAKLVHKPN